MQKTKDTVSASLEDYLEAIYILAQTNGSVRVTDIAQKLEISKPSVNRAINTLKDQGYVMHEHYGDLSLTERGEAIACGVLRRHQVLKRFLMEVLTVDEELAEEEACLMEHVMSQSTIDKLADFMAKKETEA